MALLRTISWHVGVQSKEEPIPNFQSGRSPVAGYAKVLAKIILGATQVIWGDAEEEA